MTQTRIFGIRHHGPGSARSLLRALREWQPDCLLVEGPPEGEEVLPFMLDADMEPPVALLVHCPDDVRYAAFYPFAEFSPEWQALRHGLAAGITTRFIDLPCATGFALEKAEGAPADASLLPDENPPPEPTPDCAPSGPRHDPLDWLGRAAGYGDGESWWNHIVEERGDGADVFAAIAEAMAAVRGEFPEFTASESRQRRENLREAHMRRCLRQAQKEGFERIAVVCGAWHVPALVEMPPAKDDNALLKSLPKLKVSATWAPWSNGNLSRASGYGAGIVSPGWYAHVWRHETGRAVAWLARVARLLREEDLDCSSAHLIETARLAETLGILRGRPSPGLDELNEAIRTVICHGDDTPMRLIHRKLVVGERLGKVPPSVPLLPLQRDLEQEQKRLRLKPEALEKTLDLDLRQPGDLARSHLLHRLGLLGIAWGTRKGQGYGAKGTFHEVWSLRWQPELALAVVDAGRYGNTVAQAACAKAVEQAEKSESLAELSRLVDAALLASLESAINPVVNALENRAAVSGDTSQLLEAIPPLANIVRYGNVRNTDTGLVRHVLDSLIVRASIGLSGACASLDDEAAQAMSPRIASAHRAIRLVAEEALQEEWLAALARLGGCHGLVAGLAARLRFDEQADDLDATAQLLGRALSLGNAPAMAAAWLEGFLNQNALVLLHDRRLWALVDQWVAGLSEDYFTQVLPLARRTFAAFNPPERRQLGEMAKSAGVGTAAAAQAQTDEALDWQRAERPLPLLRVLLGLSANPFALAE